MKRHQKNTPDFFDDYSGTAGEEDSIPMEDTFSRPSKAWWESRDTGSVDEDEFDLSGLGVLPEEDSGEFIPVADDSLDGSVAFDASGEIGFPEADENGDLPLDDGNSFGGASFSGRPYDGGSFDTQPYDDGSFDAQPYDDGSYDDQPYDDAAPLYEEESYPYAGETEDLSYEQGALPETESPQEDIPPLPRSRQPITPESLPVKQRKAASDPVPVRQQRITPESVPVKQRKVTEDEEEPYIAAAKPGKPFGKRLMRYVIVLVLVFVAILAALWVLLGRYQNKQDTIAEAEALAQQKAEEEAAHALAVKRAPQLAFSAWYEAMTPDDWAELWYKDQPEGVDGKDRVRDYMAQLFAGDTVAAYKGLDSTDEAPVYVIKNSEQELVRATMTGTDVNWSVESARLMLKGDKSASIRVAVGTKVFCNGKELTDEYAGEAESNFTYEPLKDFLVNPTSWTTYEVKGMLLEPELTFEAPAGSSITETAEGDCFLCLDGDEAATYQTKALDFVKAYLFYYLSGLSGTYGNLYKALAYVEPGSQAYTDLQDTYNGVIWNSAHNEIDTSDATAGGVVIWADNCYSVDVTYRATGTVQGQVDEYAATMRVYFTDSGAGFALTHFETL